jgi:hypothetical protein
MLASKEEILGKIFSNRELILEKIDDESIDIYEFLLERNKHGNITKDFLFQFVFRSFYGVDRAVFNPDWKKAFFQLMEEVKRNNDIDIRLIGNKLYKIQTRVGTNSLQFSFITKLINLNDPNRPIYDSFVARAFSFNPPQGRDLCNKIERLIKFYSEIESTYRWLSEDETMRAILKDFDNKFPLNKITDSKKIDFIVWTLGKIISKDKRNYSDIAQ